MTTRKTLDLAFSQSNIAIAQDIAQELQSLGFVINPIVIDAPEVLNPLSILSVSKHPIILLFSDNFLKSEKCMTGALKLLKYFNIPSELQPLVIDGVRMDEEFNAKSVTTRFDRISDVISYMNHWQEKYLSHEEALENGDDVDSTQVERYKNISNSIGDVLSILRNSPYLRIEEERDIDFDTIKSNFGNPKSLIVKATKEEHLSKEALSNLEEAQELLGNVDQPEASLPAENLNPNYNTELYLQDLEEDDLALLDKIAEERKREDSVLDEHSIEDLLNMGNGIASNTPHKKKNGDSIKRIESEEGEEEEIDELEEGTRPYLTEEMHDAVEEEEEDNAIDMVDLETGAADVENVDQTSTDFEDEFVQPQESYENEADPISVVHQLITEYKIEECIEYLDEAIRKYPYNLDLQYNYAKILSQHKGNYLIASDYLENILNNDKRYTPAYYLLAEIAENHKDFLLAKSYYEKVISLQPDFPDVHFRVGRIIKEQFQEQDQLALKYFKRAFKKDPKNTEAKYDYAELLYKFGDTKKSIKILRSIMKEAPLFAEAPHQLAKIYLEQGDTAKSSSLFKHAIKLNPDLDTEKNTNLFDATSSLKNEDNDIFKQYDSNRKRQKDLSKRSRIDKTVLITGATSGIGRATAALFAKEGYRVIITGRRKSRLKEIKKHFERSLSANVKHLTFDIRDMDQVRKKLGTLEGAWSQVDILINNAGLALGFDAINEGEIEHWETMIDTNIKGLLYMTRAISPNMVKRKKGHIINVCSTAGKEVYPKGNVYSATKYAVDSLTKSMRLDLYKHNIRVGQICPAMVESTEFANVRFEGDKERAKIYEDFNPLTADDVAETLYFMATRPVHVNIQDIVLMGTQQANSTNVNKIGRIFDEDQPT